MTEAPEPEDKLDAATAVVGVVNGPEDAPFDWQAIDWRVEDDVRRLRQRIFTASKAGDLSRVRSLQKLMLRSRANTLLSVRRVTERNAGRMTAGVDGEVVLTPQAKPDWPTGCTSRPSRWRPCRSGACTSRSAAAAPSVDH
ncbi:MAG: reverse transcriptase N-terminal domain-containing protein [Solirubrobacterales bacterium]|nr:reverse transcriptase N-terminal domain-containing protein [Solirubrobacterales bacterium]